ncbi:predicted protein [Histoplasma mississippiense (nom. inval.)]|uniref:predicted protein n=1 Tax=Ajellomyces capsulatus (strain NAm1 / WU24) TaxID=2059318 RepID=UPI000157BA0A|nr:predicted protein [Histoplasma mississippiense (nom. inval.)]EDN03824.1 predicted protein [Histoplasma mississippiense (nom. inval.)]
MIKVAVLLLMTTLRMKMSLIGGWLEVQKCQREGKQEKKETEKERLEKYAIYIAKKVDGESLWSRVCVQVTTKAAVEIKPGVRFQGCCWVATLGGGGVRRSEAEGVRGDGRQVKACKEFKQLDATSTDELGPRLGSFKWPKIVS